jgi:hypothetical protein
VVRPTGRVWALGYRPPPTRRGVLDEQGPARDRGAAGRWAGVLGSAALLPVLVTAPLLGLAFRADERFNPYRFGAEYSRRPQGLLVDQIANVPFFLRNGNFRPVGRVAERLQELVAFQTAEALGIAPHVAMRAFATLTLAALSVTLVVVVQTLTSPVPLRGANPSRAAAVAAPLFAVGLVATGNQTAIVLFTNFYGQSALVVLWLALLAARRGHLAAGPVGVGALTTAVVLGAATASYNEIAYLAVPAALVVVAARGLLTFGLSPRALLATRATRLLGAALAGFAAVFVPIRVLIARNCAEQPCYDQSAIELSRDSVGLLLQRVTSWYPPSAWSVATGSQDGRWYLTSNLVLLALGLAAAALTVQLWRQRRDLAPVSPRTALALVLVGVVVTVTPGVIGAISEGRLEAWRAGSIRPGAGWRETPLILVGSALTLTGLLELVGLRVPARSRPPIGAAATAVLALGLVLTVLANDAFATADARREENNLHHRIAAAVVSFDRSEEGDARRCALYEEFVALHPTRAQHQERLQLALDEVGRRAADRPWCVGTS